jgi:hypothetical protein
MIHTSLPRPARSTASSMSWEGKILLPRVSARSEPTTSRPIPGPYGHPCRAIGPRRTAPRSSTADSMCQGGSATPAGCPGTCSVLSVQSRDQHLEGARHATQPPRLARGRCDSREVLSGGWYRGQRLEPQSGSPRLHPCNQQLGNSGPASVEASVHGRRPPEREALRRGRRELRPARSSSHRYREGLRPGDERLDDEGLDADAAVLRRGINAGGLIWVISGWAATGRSTKVEAYTP